MVLPLWLTALGGLAGGAQQSFQRQQDQKNRQQMIQALLARKTQQNPAGFGTTPAAYGPQNWGAQNQVAGGVVSDQWGNPIGPAGQPAQASGAAANPAAAAPTVQPDIWSQGTGAASLTDPSAIGAPMTPGMSPAAPVPGLGGPSQAAPAGGVPGVSGQPGGFQAPNDLDNSVINALFSQQGLGL